MLYQGELTDEKLKRFLSGLIKDSQQEILLIMYHKEVYPRGFFPKYGRLGFGKIKPLYLNKCYSN